jgi:hypothetical protein
MAFFRFTRDKRGYQHFSLVEPVTNRRGKVRQRVLYWFRSPPDIKVGREPFDDNVRRALEAQNPDVTFDWRAILEAPIPSADAEKWRERRRAERAAKQALAAATVEEDTESDESEESDAVENPPARVSAESSSPDAAGATESARKKRRRRRGKRPPAEPSAAEPAASEIAVADTSTDPVEPSGD